jgi:transcription elongation GreA/GreB family factor
MFHDDGRKTLFMSVAFTREESAETAAEFQLPDRPVSSHPNFVTAAGYKALEAALAEARQAYEHAQQIEDVNERRRASAPAYRDIRYFGERLATAQIVSSPADEGAVSFGNRVTFTRNEGAPKSYRIVGEDEADPTQGSISYASPLARVLMKKTVGDVFPFGHDEIEILAIE